MEIYDTVPADSLDENDIGAVVSIDAGPVEIRAILEPPDPDSVSLRIYSLDTNEIETVTIPFDCDVHILGGY